MWHEARRQERKIRGLMVDYKKRADRRREFYEKIKLDPTQFLRVYGRPYKINFDPAVAMAAESPQSMMPWQGESSNMIDRFDVRAHLDMIPETPSGPPPQLTKSEEEEERQSNYERYRTLVENEASGLTEEQCLNEIYIDEHFGPPAKSGEEEKKKNADKKAAIGYTYEDSTPAPGNAEEEEDDSDASSDTDVETADLDVTLDVDLLTTEQEVEINAFAYQYGMREQDFVNLLRKDKAELEALKYAKQIEEEKAQFSGRKSRRERRAFKEKQLQGRRLSPPSYAARSSPKYEPYKRNGSSSRSRSRSPEDVGQVKFITSFGAESDEEGASGAVHGPSLPPAATAAQGKSDRSRLIDSHSDTIRHQSWKSRNRPSHLRNRSARSRSKSRSRSRSGSRSRRASDNRSRFRRDRHSRSRSRSRSYDRRTQDYRDRSYRYRDPPRLGRYDRDRFSAASSWGRPRSERWGSTSASRGYRRSRSRNRASRSRSKSRSRSRSRTPCSKSSSRSRSRSRSRSKTKASPIKSSSKERSMSTSPNPKPPAVVKRYRRDSLSSHSSVSDDEEGKASSKSSKETASVSRSKSGAASSLLGNSGNQSQGKLTPQERLKRKMQAQLNKQYKADKKAEVSKISKIEQERMDREEELRTRTMEMRRREREKRHREMEELERERRLRQAGSSSDSDDDDDHPHHDRSRSGSRSQSPMDTGHWKKSGSHSRSRSRSRSSSAERRNLVSY